MYQNLITKLVILVSWVQGSVQRFIIHIVTQDLFGVISDLNLLNCKLVHTIDIDIIYYVSLRNAYVHTFCVYYSAYIKII